MVEPVSEVPPPEPVAEPVSEMPAPAPEAPESPQPTTPERPTSESSTGESQAHPKSDEKSSVLPAVTGTVPPSSAAGAGSEGDATPTTGTPTGSMVINLDEAQVAGEATTASRRPAVTAVGGSDDTGCDLQGLGGPKTDGCAGGWLRVAGPLVPGGVSLAAVAAALGAAAAGGGVVSDDRNGTAGGGRPMPPIPGPAPGGASGGVAGGAGGAGIGLSGFLAFAALLGLAAPRAMRRLRLACLPCRTAFFVLIPERPG